VFHVKPGAKVKKGQAICDVIDPANPNGPKARTTYASQTDGILFSRRLDGYLSWPGQVMFRIAGPKPLAHRIGMSGLDDWYKNCARCAVFIQLVLDFAQVIWFANFNTPCAQHAVGGGGMEIQIGQTMA